MDQDGEWGTDVEMLTLAHLLQTTVYSHNSTDNHWWRFSPHAVDRTIPNDNTQMAMYIRLLHSAQHFEVVLDITR